MVLQFLNHLTLLPRLRNFCRQVFKTCRQTSLGRNTRNLNAAWAHHLLRSGRRTCSDPPTIPPLHRHIVCRPPSYYSSSTTTVYDRHLCLQSTAIWVSSSTLHGRHITRSYRRGSFNRRGWTIAILVVTPLEVIVPYKGADQNPLPLP